MVMIGDRHALIGAPFSKRRYLATIGLDFVLRQLRLGGKRRRAHTLDRARRLAVDDAWRLGGDEEIHLRVDAILLAFDVTIEQQSREPAAAHADPVARKDRPELLHVHREAAARLHAREASDARLSQAFLKTHVVREFGEIVVPPGDGGYSKFGFHGRHTPMRCLARICSCCLRAFWTDSREETSGTPTSQSASPGTQA